MMKHALSLITVFVAAASTGGQDNTAATWTLSQEFGLAVYSRCIVKASVFQEKGAVELRCTENVRPPVDITARRELTEREIATLAKLADDGNLYNGGNTGCAGGSEGPWETLTVLCCRHRDFVVLVTQCNQSFQEDGARRSLLRQLKAWQRELTIAAQKKRPR